MFSIINMVNEGDQIENVIVNNKYLKKYDINILYIHTFTDI